ncbi:MAG: helix-turn-helix transcriptional regulator [Clostridia bacterium]|nr:helix-turn-helix transcriptional regulator [Clostridia bacterium]
MSKAIGELYSENGKPLLKMWSIDVNSGERPYIKHSHSRFEITVVRRGTGEYTTEETVYPMAAGDVFVFSSNEIHCITRSEGLSITNLHFEPRYLDREFTALCFSHSEEFQNRIPAEDAGVLRENHLKIEEEFSVNDEWLPTAVRSYLDLILIDLLRNRHYRARTETRGTEVLAVYDYIDRHLCEELTLERLAEVASLTPNYFSSVFKKLNGVSLWQYINAKRIEKAVRLIADPQEQLTMLEIAARCGFNNTANFNKVFKKMKGFTPTELKKHPELLFH